MLMSEAVTVPSLMMMTSSVSKESVVRDTHTYTQTNNKAHPNWYERVKLNNGGHFQAKCESSLSLK